VTAALLELGRALRQAGLTERAVLGCFGVSAIAHIPRGRRYDRRPPPAAVAPWLLAAGGAVDEDLAARALPLAALDDAGLLERTGGAVRARVAIQPAGPHGALAVSDRFDADAADAALPPDDSSHHLVSALPRARVGRWLDLGTGTGWAPLAAAGRAATVIAADLNPRAIELARLGAALSGVALDLRVADLAAGIDGRFELVTFNAPIPVSKRDDLLARFWRAAPALVVPGGEVLVHSVFPDDLALDGALVVARYTPPGVAGFAITSWRPAGPPGRRLVEIALSPAAPHVPRAALEE
jgi:hypothetical protein